MGFLIFCVTYLVAFSSGLVLTKTTPHAAAARCLKAVEAPKRILRGNALQRDVSVSDTHPSTTTLWLDKASKDATLLFFHIEGCHHCTEMKPIVDRVAKLTGKKIASLDVMKDPDYGPLAGMLLRQSRCRGLPMFYNIEEKSFVCGKTTQENLFNWALGKKHDFSTPVDNIDDVFSRKTGLIGRVIRQTQRLEKRGESQILKNIS